MRFGRVSAAVLLVVPFAHAAGTAAAPPPTLRERVTEPFVGVRLVERYLDEPRRLSVRVLEIDPDAEGIRFAMTPREPGLPHGDETTTQTTAAFVASIGAQLGFNGSFFRLEHHSQQRATNNISLIASGGDVYSPWEARMPHALAIARDGTPSLVTPADGDHFFNAVAGNVRLLKGGVLVPHPRMPGSGKMNDRHPRTAAGITAEGHLLVMTVDGRQPGFSEGVFLDELGELLRDAGAVEALNLDGGGSTTLVADLPGDARGPRLLNSAVGRGPVGSQRNNGVNVAVFARPAEGGERAEPLAVAGDVLEDFEADEGRFTGAYESGSTRGVDAKGSRVDRVQDAAAVGRGAQRLAVKAAGGGGPVEVRLLSAGGDPKQNAPFAPVGRLSLFAQNLGPAAVEVAPIIDDADGHERGVPRVVPSDLAWHPLHWDLADPDDWAPFAGGNGRLDAATVTMDALHASSRTGFVLLWDQLSRQPPPRR